MLVLRVRDAREQGLRLADPIVQRLRQQPRFVAVCQPHHLALAAHVDDAALAVQFFLAELLGPRRRESAVVPRQLHRRHVAARRELIVGRCRVRKADAVERRRQCFDHGRQTEVQRLERMIDQVRAHVAERTLAPVHPSAPVMRMIDRVVIDVRRHAEEEIPRERRRDGRRLAIQRVGYQRCDTS